MRIGLTKFNDLFFRNLHSFLDRAFHDIFKKQFVGAEEYNQVFLNNPVIAYNVELLILKLFL
ncbi:MAG: hypothetical protein DMENIID0002_04520 [Rickettsia endosymbiont of Sergentomyia squamirostris]|uniref:Uncharacterized protein n=1 Tax=Candidatus Tisiphia endosymbiont of Sergentomyia squamirostris TaxID=3113639 RepID=A0AAT9G7P4_9RICK